MRPLYLLIGLLFTPLTGSFGQDTATVDFLKEWVPKLYALQPVKDVQISPTGQYVAYREATNNKWEIKLYHADTGTTTTLPIDRNSSTIKHIAWDGPDQLFIELSFYKQSRTYTPAEAILAKNKYVIYQPSSGEFLPVVLPKSSTLNEIQSSPAVPYRLTGLSFRRYPDVYTFDWRTGETIDHVKNTQNVVSWCIDPEGICRLGEISKNRKTTFRYRPALGKKWGHIKHLNGNKFIGFDATGQTLYYASWTDQDNFGLAPLDLATQEVGPIIRDEPYDIGNSGLAEYDPRTGGFFGYTYAAEIPRTYYYEPQYRDAYETISKMYPGTVNRVLGFLSDGKTAVVSHSSEVDQGSYLFYDSDTKTLTPWLNPTYAAAKETLARTTPFQTTARDGKTVFSYLTLPTSPKPAAGYPLLILLKDDLVSRDYFIFNPEVQLYANRGIAVLQINFRGSIGFGSAYEVRKFMGIIEKGTNDIVDVTGEALRRFPLDTAHVTLSGRRLAASLAFRAVSQRPDLFTTLIGLHGFYDYLEFYNAASASKEWWIDDLCNDFKPTRYLELSPVSLTYNFTGRIIVFEPNLRTALNQGMGVDLSKIKTLTPIKSAVRDSVYPTKMSHSERISYYATMLYIIEDMEQAATKGTQLGDDTK